MKICVANDMTYANIVLINQQKKISGSCMHLFRGKSQICKSAGMKSFGSIQYRHYADMYTMLDRSVY